MFNLQTQLGLTSLSKLSNKSLHFYFPPNYFVKFECNDSNFFGILVSDAASSKLFPKASRKREPTGYGNATKYDQPRRSNAQKTKITDKRPKPKGYYHDSPKESSKVVDDESAELGSVMVQGSKKQNLNHLLNFHYAPREVQGGWNNGRSSGFNNHYNRWLPPIQRHKYNKEQFLQAK